MENNHVEDGLKLDIQIRPDPIQEAEYRAKLERLQQYNCVWIDGEWAYLGS